MINWPEVPRNISKARQVWIRLGKILQREVSDQLVSAMFYLEMVQAVLLLGEDTCVLSASMSKNLEGVHVGFLRKVTVKTPKRQRDGTWRSVAAESLLKEAGTNTPGTSIDKRQEIVEDWVASRQILEVFNRGAGYDVGRGGDVIPGGSKRQPGSRWG